MADSEQVLTQEQIDAMLAGGIRWTPSLRQPEGQIKRVSHPYARFHHA